jgi:hypothetical protein
MPKHTLPASATTALPKSARRQSKTPPATLSSQLPAQFQTPEPEDDAQLIAFCNAFTILRTELANVAARAWAITEKSISLHGEAWGKQFDISTGIWDANKPLHDTVDALRKQISEMRPSTLEGFVAKAKIAQMGHPELWVGKALCADLIALYEG